MKNILYKLKFIAVAVLTLSLTSCDAILDDEVVDYGAGPDFVGFSRTTVTAPFEVDGDTKGYNATLRLFGPGLEEFNEDVVVTFEIDETASTVEEGVHYTFSGGNTVTLTKENNYTANIPFTVITENVEPPVSETLVLRLTDVSTASNNPVVISGTAKTQTITFSYICFADLSGTYTMTNTVCEAEVVDITITANEDGGWDLSTADGGLLQYCSSNTGLQNNGSIVVVCGEILPSQDLAFCPDYGIGCITGGTWDAETGTLTLTHTNDFFSWANGTYSSTYVRTSGGPDTGGSDGDETDGEETDGEETDGDEEE